MPSPELERLVALGHLKVEPPHREEIDGLVRSGDARLRDAGNEDLSADSRFDLAYGAVHAFAVAALRLRGLRADKRYLVFQALPHTLGVGAPTWRLISKCHEQRNRTEYEGLGEIDATLLRGLLQATSEVREALGRLLDSV